MGTLIKYQPNAFEDKYLSSELECGYLVETIIDFRNQFREDYPNMLKEKVHISINGEEWHVDNWSECVLEENDIVEITPVIGDTGNGGFITTIIGVTLMAAAVAATLINPSLFPYMEFVFNMGMAMAIGGAAMMLFGPSAPSLPGFTSEGGTTSDSPSYRWDGITTQAVANIPVPIVYGDHWVGGNVLDYKVRYQRSGDEWLYLVLGFSEGEIEGIFDSDNNVITEYGYEYCNYGRHNYSNKISYSLEKIIPNIKIDGKDITDFNEDDWQWDWRPGKNTQEAIKEDGSETLTQVNSELDTDGYKFTTDSDTKKVFINLQYPNGLFYVYDDGSYWKQSVWYKIGYKRDGVGDINDPNDYIWWGTKVSKKKSGEFKTAITRKTDILGSPIETYPSIDLTYGTSSHPRYYTKVTSISDLKAKTYNINSDKQTGYGYVNVVVSIKKCVQRIAYRIINQDTGKELSYGEDRGSEYREYRASHRINVPRNTKIKVIFYTRQDAYSSIRDPNVSIGLCDDTEKHGNFTVTRTLPVGDMLGKNQESYNIWVKRHRNKSTNVHINDTLYLRNYSELDASTEQHYPNTAVLLLKLKANKLSHGGIPNILTKIRGIKVQVPHLSYSRDYNDYYYHYDYNNISYYRGLTSPYWSTSNNSYHPEKQWTNNPVYCLRDLLLNTRYGLGNYINTSMIDENYIETAGKYAWGLATESSNKEHRFHLDIVLDNSMGAYETVAQIAKTFRGWVVWSEGTLKILIDKPETPVQLFSMGNIIKDSFSETFLPQSNTPNQIEAQFSNAEDNNEITTIEVVNEDAWANGTPRRSHSEDMRGITRESQAIRESTFLLNAALNRKTAVSFKGGLDSIHCLAKGTKIYTLSRGYVNIEDIIASDDPKIADWTWSIVDNDFKPTYIKHNICQGYKEVIKINLASSIEDDNNFSEIICTPDHEILLTTGEWKEAGKLEEGDSIRSLYNKKYKGYNYIIYKGERWVPQYVKSYKSYYNESTRGSVVHHNSFDKNNDIPLYLNLLTNEEHAKLHKESAEHAKQALIKWWKELKADEKRYKEWNENNHKWQKDCKGRKKLSENIKERLANETKEEKVKIIEKRLVNYFDAETLKYLCDKDWLYEKYISEQLSTVKIGKLINVSDSVIGNALRRYNIPVRKHHDWYKIPKQKEKWLAARKLAHERKQEEVVNHTVISIEKLNKKVEVYDLSIEGSNNFVANGCVVHNCVAGDLFNFQHEVNKWGYGGRIVDSISASAIRTDMDFVATTNDVLMCRLADGSIEEKIVSEAATTDHIIRTRVAFSSVPQKDSVWAYGKRDVDIKTYRALQIGRTEGNEVTVAGIEYVASVYTTTHVVVASPARKVSIEPQSDFADPVEDLEITLRPERKSAIIHFKRPEDTNYSFAEIWIADSSGAFKFYANDYGEGDTEVNNITPSYSGRSVRVYSVNKLGIVNKDDYAEDTIDLTGYMPWSPTGLRLIDGRSPTEFLGKDAKFEWRARSTVAGFGVQEYGKDAGLFSDETSHISFRIEIWVNNIMVRNELVSSPSYIYTYEKNVLDNGTAQSSFEFKVYAFSLFGGKISTDYTSLTVSNSVPVAITSITKESIEDGAVFRLNKSNEDDFSHYTYRYSVRPKGGSYSASSDWKNTFNNEIQMELSPSQIVSQNRKKSNIKAEFYTNDLYSNSSSIYTSSYDTKNLRREVIVAPEKETGVYTSIASALNDITNDSEIDSCAIYVKEGEYNINDVISLPNKDISIIGAGYDKTSFVGSPQGVSYGAFFDQSSLNYNTYEFKNFSIRSTAAKNFNKGIYLNKHRGDLNVSGIKFILQDNGNYYTKTASMSGDFGLYTYDLKSATSYNISVKNCIASGGERGISLFSSGVMVVEDNEIKNSLSNSIHVSGGFLFHKGGTHESFKIKNNSIFNKGGFSAISVTASPKLGEISNNDITIFIGSSHKGDTKRAILLSAGGSNTNIINNRIRISMDNSATITPQTGVGAITVYNGKSNRTIINNNNVEMACGTNVIYDGFHLDHLISGVITNNIINMIANNGDTSIYGIDFTGSLCTISNNNIVCGSPSTVNGLIMRTNSVSNYGSGNVIVDAKTCIIDNGTGNSVSATCITT